MDLRERIVETARPGQTQVDIAKRFRVSVQTVRRYLKKAKEGELRPKPKPGRPRMILLGDEAELLRQVDASSDATLFEHCQEWQKAHGVRVSVSTMHRSISRGRYSLKKKRS